MANINLTQQGERLSKIGKMNSEYNILRSLKESQWLVNNSHYYKLGIMFGFRTKLAQTQVKTGLLIEVKQFNQYTVRIDGSGRVTLKVPYQNQFHLHPLFQNQSSNTNLHSIQDWKQHQPQQMLKHHLPQAQDLLKVHIPIL